MQQAAGNLPQGVTHLGEPFLRGLGIAYADTEARDDLDAHSDCLLCKWRTVYALENVVPYVVEDYDVEGVEEEESEDEDGVRVERGTPRWGFLFDLNSGEHICLDKAHPHAFHARCLRAYVLEKRSEYKQLAKCYTCALLSKAKAQRAAGAGAAGAAAGADDASESGSDVDFSDVEDAAAATKKKVAGEEEQLWSKRRKRPRQRYQIWVHVVQVTGLKKADSDTTINPMAVVQAFGQTKKTKVGDAGKTYACVWDQPFRFETTMDEAEFEQQLIEVEVVHKRLLWNQTIGKVQLGAKTINSMPDCEIHRKWLPLVLVGKTKHEGGGLDQRAVSLQGKVQLSVCVLSEENIKQNPRLPIHVYDLEVQMWDDMDHTKAVVDFDLSNEYLQLGANHLRELEKGLVNEGWHLVHMRIYKAEHLPKMDRRTWADGMVEIEHPSLGGVLKSEHIEDNANPNWNWEVTIPVSAGGVTVDRLQMRVLDWNRVGANEFIGGHDFSLNEILFADTNNTGANLPRWYNIYMDPDGQAPTFRGRVLVEFTVERNCAAPTVSKSNIKRALPPDLQPPLGRYALEMELYEGVHLQGGHEKYDVDISWGHPQSDRDHGMFWQTFSSRDKPDKATDTVSFLKRAVAVVPGLPIERKIPVPAAAAAPSAAANAVSAVSGAVSGAVAGAVSGIANALPHKAEREVHPDSVQKGDFVRPPKHKKMYNYLDDIPDIIITVSKAGDRSKCIGFLRVPVNGVKRATENWELGQDLTIFPSLLDSAEDGDAMCLPLSPVVELYDAVSSFLLLRLRIREVDQQQAHEIAKNASKVQDLPFVPRQKYKFVANVFQAKHLASVDSSGLSSPMATVRLMNHTFKTRVAKNTTFPLWFEQHEGEVTLPENLAWAPNLTLAVYHGEGKLRWGHSSHFMGQVEVRASQGSLGVAGQNPPPRWYPLHFEELQFGEILFSFALTPVDMVDKLRGGVPAALVNMDDLVRSWTYYNVDISALSIRGAIAQKFGWGGAHNKDKKKTGQPVRYELECWDKVHHLEELDNDLTPSRVTVTARKPNDPVFYSSINVRVFKGKELEAVTSIPVDQLLRTNYSWYKLIDLLMRDPQVLGRKVIRKWRKFVELRAAQREREGDKEERKRLRKERDERRERERLAREEAAKKKKKGKKKKKKGKASDHRKSVTDPPALGDDDVVLDIDDEDTDEEKTADSDDDSGAAVLPASQEVKSDGNPVPGQPHIDPIVEGIAENHYLQPRVDAEGKEIVDPLTVQHIVCERVEREIGSEEDAFDRHWRVRCEYEKLPFVREPFSRFDLVVGKDEVHQGWLEKLFVQSKHAVGHLRANFHAYLVDMDGRPLGKAAKKKKKNKKGKRASRHSMSSDSDSSDDEDSDDEFKWDGDDKDGKAAERGAKAWNSEESVFDFEAYLSRQEYSIRVYVLRALQLSAKADLAQYVDPFVTLEFGGTQSKTKVVEGTINPQFFIRHNFEKKSLPSSDSQLVVQVWDDSGRFGADLIGGTVINLEDRVFSKQWLGDRRPIERRPLFKAGHSLIPQGFVELCIDVVPTADAIDYPLDYLLNPPRREPWELRVTLLNAKNVTPKDIHHSADEGCCAEVCLPPDQSDIRLVCGMSGPNAKAQKTDTHLRSVGGEGMWNWRTIHDVKLPSPVDLSNLKIQVWNVNWSPNDCIAECVIPLWGFFEFARRQYERNQDDRSKWVCRIEKQWVHMTHPQTSDQGDVQLEIELLPKSIASAPNFKAAEGKKGFDKALNAPDHVLEPPKRPETSFPWYRLDKQLLFRIKYAWKKIRIYVFIALFLFLVVVGLGMWFFYETQQNKDE